MKPSAASLASRSKWVSRRSHITRCCEPSKSWEPASRPSSVKNSSQALRVPDTDPCFEKSFIEMYGPPQNCKRKTKDDSWSALMYSAFSGVRDPGHDGYPLGCVPIK